MNIWVFVVRSLDDTWATTHLTEKGALLAAITDVTEYLSVDHSYFESTEDEKTYPKWRHEELKAMPRAELWKVLHDWWERTWDHHNYVAEVVKTQVAP